MRIAHAIAASALLTLPAAAFSADWWWTGTSDTSRSMVERSSIARSGSWATAWLQDFFLSPRGVNLFSARYLVQHDCARREVMVLSAQAFDGDGRPVPGSVPDRHRPDGDLRAICENDWSGATRVGDVEGEVRIWRVLNDK